MTDAPHNPTGKGSEADNASAQSVEHNKFADILQLTHNPLLGAHVAAKTEEHRLKPADDRSTGTAFADGVTHSLAGMVTGTGAMLGTHVKTDAQIQEEIKHNAAAGPGPNVLVGLWNTGKNLVTHLPEIATGSAHALGQAYETARHGTANQRAELAGGATAFIGTMLVGGAGNVGKLSTEGRVLEGAETAYAEAQGARTAMGEYTQSARVASDAAVKTVEEKAAVSAAEHAAIKPILNPEAIAHTSPVANTARVARELTAPAVAEVAPTTPSMFSRFRSTVASPFKSLFGTPEGAGAESKNLATRVDGLKAGEGEGSLAKPTFTPNVHPTVHPAERFPVGLRPSEPRIGEVRLPEPHIPERAVIDRPSIKMETSVPERPLSHSSETPRAEVSPHEVTGTPVEAAHSPAPIRTEIPRHEITAPSGGAVPAPIERAAVSHEAPAMSPQAPRPTIVGEPKAIAEQAENMATVEKVYGSSAEAAAAKGSTDVLAGREVADLKSSVEKLTAPPNVVEAPVASTAPALSTPTVAATKATTSVENIGRLSADSGITLSADAERSLQNLGRNLQGLSESADPALALGSRKELASDLATVEKALAKTGGKPAVVRELNDLKASINEIAPAAAPIAPVSEAPAAIAAETSAKITSFNKVLGDAGLKLAPEADRALSGLSNQLEAISAAGAETIPTATTRELGENLAQVERSLSASGADAGVMRQFNELKSSLGDLSTASGERSHLNSFNQSMTALEGHGAELTNNVQGLARTIDDLPALSSADQKIASTLSTRLEAIEQKIAERGLEKAPVSTSADIQKIVRELEQPEFSRFFAEHPQAARAFEDLQIGSRNLAASSSQVEASQLGLNSLKQARAFEGEVDGLANLSRDLKTTLPTGEAAQPAARALESIENNLTTIKSGANPEAVLRQVNSDIAVIERSGITGADKIAAELRQNVGQLENTTTVLDRTRRLEESITTISKQSSSLEGQTAKLSQQFADDARTTASTGSMVPTNAQVSDQLQLISRQSRLIDASESGVNALTRIKNAYTRIEELTAGETLGTEQSAALRQIKESIGDLDRASVEATGLRRFESTAPKITEQSTRVEALSERLSQSVDLAAPAARQVQLDQRLAEISRTAQEVKSATTLDDQVRAVNKLATAVQDTDLQAALGRNTSGLRTFDELNTSTAELHEAVSYRALERSRIAAEAEAENSARAARALETRIQSDAVAAKSPTLQNAVSDYRNAAEAFAKAPDKNLAAVQLDQKYAALQTELKAAAPSTSILQGEELAALRRSQAGLSQSAADSELLSRSLIDRRLPAVEKGFDQVAVAGNSVAQREIMRGISDQIQSMRYLEARVGDGADKLTQAQMQLSRAQNELEAATYRGNLVKMAAAGNQSATDKLLISGLTSDGYKATSIAHTSGPAARLVEDFAKNRIGLLGRDKGSFSVRSLAASDPLFVNNPGWLSASAIRNTGYTLIGVGGITFGVGRVREALSTEATTDSKTVTGSDTANTAANPAIMDAATNAAASPSSTVDNRSVGRATLEPNGLSRNGQNLARNAFTQDMTMQALPRTSSVAGDGTLPFVAPTQNSGSLYDAALSPEAANFAAASQYAASLSADNIAPQSGSFMLDRNDPDLAFKLFNISISGTLYGVKKGADAVAPGEIRTPLSVAQSLQLRPNTIKTTESGRLDKLATSMFAVPSAQLSSPMALGYGRRDIQSGRIGGAGFAGYSSVGGRSDTSALAAASMMSADADASAAEGGVNAGTKHLKHVESGSESRIDSNAVHSGGGSTAQNNVDDEDEHNGNDPQVAPSTTVAAGVAPTSASPVMARRVPNAGKPDDTGAAGAVVSQSDLPAGDSKGADARKSSPVGAPPRKRANQDAISA
ncbi:MAG: hypothetical protein KGS72_24305 [Cyanobacteria bacterium REEB67]|nr:hypothetical protein [Cyanobacteria bacterium REEB67]